MNLLDFIIEAKVNAWANQNSKEDKLEDGGRKLTYQNGIFTYEDSYQGSHDFLGREVVWERGNCIWAMGYYGRIISKINDKEGFNIFLKESLRKVPKDMPFRGPEFHENDLFKYENIAKELNHSKISGVGRETIKEDERLVYVLDWHGGPIKK